MKSMQFELDQVHRTAKSLRTQETRYLAKNGRTVRTVSKEYGRAGGPNIAAGAVVPGRAVNFPLHTRQARQLGRAH